MAEKITGLKIRSPELEIRNKFEILIGNAQNALPDVFLQVLSASKFTAYKKENAYAMKQATRTP